MHLTVCHGPPTHLLKTENEIKQQCTNHLTTSGCVWVVEVKHYHLWMGKKKHAMCFYFLLVINYLYIYILKKQDAGNDNKNLDIAAEGGKTNGIKWQFT